MSEPPAVLWGWLQAAGVRWAKVRNEPGLPPPMRHALDIAAAVQQLVVLGDPEGVAALAKSAQRRLEAARPGLDEDRETRRRKSLRGVVRYLVEREEARPRPATHDEERERLATLATEIVHAIEVRSPELNVLALPGHRRPGVRADWPTTPAQRAKAVERVHAYLRGGGRDVGAIVERALKWLGVGRDRARTVAMRKTGRKPGK